MKHYGDNDASLKPRFLPVMTAAHSTWPASPPPLYRWTPCSHLISLRESTYWAARVNRFISLNVSPWEKSLLFPGDLSTSQVPQPRRFIARVSLFWKGFQGKTVIDFHTLVSLPPSHAAIIIHSRHLSWHFPSTALLEQIWGTNDCQSLKSPSAKEHKSINDTS